MEVFSCPSKENSVFILSGTEQQISCVFLQPGFCPLSCLKGPGCPLTPVVLKAG